MGTFTRQCTDMVVPSAGLLLVLLFLTGCLSTPVHRGRSVNYTTLNTSDFFEDIVSLPVPKLIRKYGYPIETHMAITQDGYVLTLHRIPYGRNRGREHPVSGDKPLQNIDFVSRAKKRGSRSSRRTTEKRRPAVLLVPGLLATSVVFILSGPEKGLAFVLAQRGYDVWILNPRGTPDSMDNVKIPPTDDRFWIFSLFTCNTGNSNEGRVMLVAYGQQLVCVFSWNEIGVYDVPASLDLVRQRTGFRKVPVIGHSMGNTVMLVAGSMVPEVSDKVSLMVALAPTASFRYMRSPIVKSLANIVPALTNMTDGLRSHSLSFGNSFHKLLLQMCKEPSVTVRFCKALVSMTVGADPEELDSKMLSILLANYPSSSSVNTLFHYGQLIRNNGEFRQFDYNPKRNMELYGSPIPPEYPLDRVRFPVALLYAQNDLLSSVKDVEYLSGQLHNVVDMYQVQWPKFNHLDFIMAINAQTLVFDHVLELLVKYGPS